MNRERKILAIITARGGSKSLPDKNIKKLKGKPLIYYTIKAALKSKLINKSILSTDSKKIIKISKKFGIEVPFIRPKKLASDTSHHPEVIEHAVRYLEKKTKEFFDIIVMLQPTSPFRKNFHIDQAIKKFLKEKNKSLISVKKQDYPPWWMFKISQSKLKTNFNWMNKNVFNMERQEFPSLYRPNGAIYVTTRKNLKNSKSIVNLKSCGFYLMNPKDSIDIDTEIDLKIAENTKI